MAFEVNSNSCSRRMTVLVAFEFSPCLHYLLVPRSSKINIGNTGNQNHPDLKLRVVLVTCFVNIDYFQAGNQPIMQKW